MATDLVGYTDVTCTGVRVHCPWGDGADPVVVFGDDEPITLPGRGLYVHAETVNGQEWAVTAPQDDGDQAWLISRSTRTRVGLGNVNGQYPVIITRAGRVFTMPAFGDRDPRNGTIRREFDLTGKLVAEVTVPRTSQGFAGVDEATGEPRWMVAGAQTIDGKVVNRPVWDGDWMVCMDNRADRLLGYHRATRRWVVVAEVTTQIGAKVRTQPDGSAMFAISLPGLWVPTALAKPYTPPPFPKQQASVLVIGDHDAAETIAVIDRPGDPRNDHTAGVFATEFRDDLALGAAQAASLDVPLYVYRDRPVYGPDPVYRQPGCTVMPTLRCYPERDGSGWATQDARVAALEPQVAAAENAGYRGQLAMVLPVYTASGAWTVEQVLAHIDAAVRHFAGRIRTWILFEQSRGADDGIAHVAAFAEVASRLKAACALPAPRATHQPAPSEPKPEPTPEPAPPPPIHEEPPMPTKRSVPPPPPTREEQLRAYHAPQGQPPGPGYVWMAGGWVYYGAGAASASAAMQHNAEAQWKTPTAPLVQPVMQRLHVDGPIFRTEDGQPWQWRGESMLILPYLWSTGVDVRPVLRAARARGTTIVRCFLQHKFMLWPEVVDFVLPIDRVGPLSAVLRDEGMYVLFTIGCDGQAGALGQSYEWQRDRVRDVIDAVHDANNVVLELWNKEQAGVDPDDNGCDVERIARDLGLFDRTNRPVPMALGYYPKTGHEPNFPVLDFVAGKQPRKSDWTTECGKVGRNVHEQTGAAYAEAEPSKFSAPDDPDGEADEHDPATSPLRAEEAAAACALAATGFTFHSVSGIHARELTPLEQECCERAMAAMALIPPDAALWDYTHDGMGNCPLEPVGDPAIVGEVAGRVTDGRAILVGSMATDGWNPVARDGWRIVDRKLEGGRVIDLRR
jgi:hypothetical protein